MRVRRRGTGGRARAAWIRRAPDASVRRARYAHAVRRLARLPCIDQSARLFDGLPPDCSELGQHLHLGGEQALMHMVVGITGASGFIGSALVERHIAAGDVVRLLTRSPRAVMSPRTVAMRGDLATPDGNLGRFVDGLDVLYHCAGEVRDPIRMRAVNVDGTRAR